MAAAKNWVGQGTYCRSRLGRANSKIASAPSATFRRLTSSIIPLKGVALRRPAKLPITRLLLPGGWIQARMLLDNDVRAGGSPESHGLSHHAIHASWLGSRFTGAHLPFVTVSRSVHDHLTSSFVETPTGQQIFR